MSPLNGAIAAVERGWLPEGVVRWAIRRLCRQRLSAAQRDAADAPDGVPPGLAAQLRQGPVAPAPRAANEQHYELPAEFFAAVLGPRLKYSCCLWPEAGGDLAAAENAALAQVCERAQIAEGQRILELGCGWGSLALWMAERYPRCRVWAVSNSRGQKEFVLGRAARRGLRNLEVVTADMNDFEPPARALLEGGFDRVVSVEMFEHMRNYAALLGRLARWLRPDGRLFVHVFCHRRWTYAFDDAGPANWMGRYFFTGGLMPGRDLLPRFDDALHCVRQWDLEGEHYRRTAEAWLANFDRRADDVREIFRETYGPRDAARWFHRWRTFFFAVAELFGYEGGAQWQVGHYLFEPKSQRAPALPLAPSARTIPVAAP